MTAYGFTITDHDSARPWIVVGREHHTVELDDGVGVLDWAGERWPGPRWRIELDPWQLAPDWPGSAKTP